MRRLVPLALFALTACPTSTKPTDGGQDIDSGVQLVGRACNVDVECGALRCDKVRHQCICLSDTDCPAQGGMPQYCNNYTGLCVSQIAGCTSDAMCNTGEYCDSNTRSCQELKSFCEPCTANAQCGGAQDDCVLDSNLNQKFCGTSCMADSECPRGASCLNVDAGTKQCWPSMAIISGQTPSCKNFQGCTPDSLRTCNMDSDCGDVTQRCDPRQGKCVAVQQVCPFGTTCDPRNKICVADCVLDVDCGDPSLHCVNKVCEPIDECGDDSACPANKICNVPPGADAGACVPFCTADTDCPVGQACLQVNGKYRCAPGCSTNTNCPLDQRCNAQHQCEGPVVNGKQVCQGTPACASCQVCNLASNECVSTKDTDGGYYFPYCVPCSSPSECTGGTCVTLTDGNSYCARYCTTGSECPQSFTCLTLTSGMSACVPSNRQCSGQCP
ncbi:MAG: hypothetical protein QM723_35305 [Myxococcaceae bacterium]